MAVYTVAVQSNKKWRLDVQSNMQPAVHNTKVWFLLSTTILFLFFTYIFCQRFISISEIENLKTNSDQHITCPVPFVLPIKLIGKHEPAVQMYCSDLSIHNCTLGCILHTITNMPTVALLCSVSPTWLHLSCSSEQVFSKDTLNNWIIGTTESMTEFSQQFPA